MDTATIEMNFALLAQSAEARKVKPKPGSMRYKQHSMGTRILYNTDMYYCTGLY
jgi:hypothetical protein